MTRVIFAVPLLLAMATAPLSMAAADTKPAKHHVKRDNARVLQQPKIACTKSGCFPIAPNCTPYGQLDWRGNPTGYDGIACR